MLAGCKRTSELRGPGGLVWTQDVIEIKLEPGESRHHISFPVRNSGDKPEVIESVSSECGCLLGDSPGVEIAPGAAATVPMTFRANVLMGETIVEKTVKVRLRGHESHAALAFRAHVPATISATPAHLEWKPGDLSWQEVALESPLEFQLLQIRASSTGFQWEASSSGKSSRTFFLKVRPLKVESRMSLLTLETSLPDPWSKLSVPLLIGTRMRK